MKHKIFILVQIVFLVVTVIGIFILYPKADLNLVGNKVSFNAINVDVIILSKNPDFSNPRYIDINDSVEFNLKPGRYYWKASNGIINSFAKEFDIDSEVGLEIIEKDNNYELKNVGDVRVNVTKTKDGTFVGHVILEPYESKKIDSDNKVFTGREDNEI